MKFRALKNQLLLAPIVVGAIAIAVPVAIFGIIGVLWRAFKSWVRPNRPVVSEKIRRSVAAVGSHIAGVSPGTASATRETEAAGHAFAFPSIPPEVLEPIRRHLGVADRVLDILVSEIGL